MGRPDGADHPGVDLYMVLYTQHVGWERMMRHQWKPVPARRR